MTYDKVKHCNTSKEFSPETEKGIRKLKKGIKKERGNHTYHLCPLAHHILEYLLK